MEPIYIKSLEELDQAATRLLSAIEGHPVIALSGEMGAGKTTLIQAMCKAAGVEMDVNSPTFSLVNEYFTGQGTSIFHFDLYRIDDPSELFDLGYEEYFCSGSRCYIEWPEKAPELIPADALTVHIVVHEDGTREIRS